MDLKDASSGVRVVFAGEMVREDEPAANPTIDEVREFDDFRVLSLEALVRVKLTAFHRKDQVHLLDLMGVGLIDDTWPSRLLPVLGEWLQQLLDDPNG